MDKILELEMKSNKDIEIRRNEIHFMTIPSNDRKIRAAKIFELLDYTKGDKFEIKVNNPNNIDAKVLNYFSDLLVDITRAIQSQFEEETE